MKIYEINGRKVWLDKAPEGYKAPAKEQPKKYEEPKVDPVEAEEPETKAKPAPANKAKKAPSNKARKAGRNK